MSVLEDGVIGAEEFRYDCASRIAVDNVDILDKAYQSLLNVSVVTRLFKNKIKMTLLLSPSLLLMKLMKDFKLKELML